MASSSSAGGSCVHAIDHIKKLPDADRALEMMQELKRHIDPLLKARGWKVLRCYEICCCTSGGKNLGVGGFCVPAGDKVTSLRIALRLREPKTHQLHDFDHAMRILLHEVSHIVHGNHSASFYELMEELTRQYETFREKGQVLDAQGMPMVGGRKADTSRHNPTSMAEARQRALSAAEARARTGAVLGGGGRVGGGDSAAAAASSSAPWRSAPPGEMARRAAEARQRRWDVENGLEAEELEAARASQEEPNDGAEDGTSGAAAVPASASSAGIVWGAPGAGTWQKVPCPVCGPVCSASKHRTGDPPPQDAEEGGGEDAGAARNDSAKKVVVDLTLSDDEDAGGPKMAPLAKRARAAGAALPVPPIRGHEHPTWRCPRCTYAFNDASSSRCEMECGEARPGSGSAATSGGLWTCKHCTLQNAKEATHCTACQAWRYSRPDLR